MMTEPSVWIVGDWRHADFSAAIASIKEKTRCEFFDNAWEAIKLRPQSPQAILLVQSRPGQISSSDVERLHAASPLARLAALVGPWCAGELRSGQPWPGVVRVPWRAWHSRLIAELGLVGSNGGVAPRYPRTESETDRIERKVKFPKQAASNHTKVMIRTDRKDRFESLAD